MCQLTYNGTKRYLSHAKKRMFWNLTIQFIILSTFPPSSLHMTKLYFVTWWIGETNFNELLIFLNSLLIFQSLVSYFLAYPSKYSQGGEVRQVDLLAHPLHTLYIKGLTSDHGSLILRDHCNISHSEKLSGQWLATRDSEVLFKVPIYVFVTFWQYMQNNPAR